MSSERQPDVVLSARALGKMYNLYSNPQDRLKHTLFWRFGKTFGHSFWALQDVTFELHRGETFGVIGRNGSGKSTLLQILAGILTPTSGDLVVKGRVAALLELGSGFNPEFTGRENVILYSSILGIPRQEMLSHLDEIIAFADIGEFIDQPVKLYSSGMFLRLAFSVAAGVDADILLIDEALAVGDIFFRQKCYQRLETLRKKGATIILVSHAMNEVEQFCERALILDKGMVIFQGSAIEAVKRYYFLEQISSSILNNPSLSYEPLPQEIRPNTEAFAWPSPNAFLKVDNLTQVSEGEAACKAIAICDEHGYPCSVFQQGETASFYYEFEVHHDIEIPIGGVEIINEKGLIVHGKNSLQYNPPVPLRITSGQRVRFRQDICLAVAVGEYTFNVGFSTIDAETFQIRDQFSHPDLIAKIPVLCIVPNVGTFAVIYRRNGKPIQLLHYGTADLPGQSSISINPDSAA